MPIPGPGTAISMTTIATEFGGTVPHSLSEYYRGGGLVANVPSNNPIPTSGTIAMGNFYGTGGGGRVAVNLTIASNVQNYDVFANRGPTYSAGTTDVTVTVNPGIVVGSASTGSFAMLVPSAFDAADTVTIVNNGTIIGMGGNGGNGGSGGPAAGGSPGTPGGVGGSALSVSRPTIVTNNGTVAAGGGGGGGGGALTSSPLIASSRRAGGGGGGGAGNNVGTGGSGGGGAPQGAGAAGSPGTLTTGGAGGPGTVGAVPGGPGGGQGAAGSPGVSGPRGAGAGAGSGNYITGNPFVTWPVTGTRLGGVA